MRIVGIDLGTTNSAVAIMEGGAPRIIPVGTAKIMPSVVAFKDGRPALVGEEAKRYASLDPQNVIYSIKRFMGRRREEVVEEERLVPYGIVGREGEAARVAVKGRELAPPEVSALILRHLKEAAEAYLGEEVERAVITVPAYFNDGQRQATKEAGEIAGLKVERILNEPTAAALAYGLDRKLHRGKIAVFDLGGGTFDISLLELSQGIFQVLAVNGDTHLGGDDFDQRIVQYLADGFSREQGIDLRGDPVAWGRLREAAEAAKCQLSMEKEAVVELPFIATGPSGPLHLSRRLTREELEGLIADLLDRCRPPCLQAIKDAGLKPEDLDEVILVGGSTRMPTVRALVRDLFRREPNTSVNPEEAVALGAAVQASILEGRIPEFLLLDVTPLSLGIETYGGLMSVLIPRNTTIPASAKETFTTFVDGQVSVEIHVLQGERELAKDNRSLARFQLPDIPPQPAGVPRIEVTFTIDANGILNVSATDLKTGKAQAIQVKPSSGLSEEEVERMVQESLAYAQEDMQQRFLIEARVEADRVIAATERVLSEGGELILPEERETILPALEACKRVREGGDVQAIRDALKALDEAAFPLARRLMAKAAEIAAEETKES